jgi:HPt (histidine-containing phosphotransfer) domain-containing protein
MDGAITLDSILGAGTTVQFTARLKRAIAVIPEQSVRESLEGLRALVVDPTAGAAMVATLRAHGVLADAAGDLAAACAAAARAQVSGEPIQLVVVDSAPGVTAALEGVAGLRMACGGSPRIMLLTGAGLRGDAARCRAAGIDAYLTRPVKDTELLEAIRMMIPDPDRRAGLITRHSLRERRRSARAEADAPKRAATQRPLFERTAVLENLGGDLDILHEVARASLPDIQTGLTEIRRALENEDAAALVAAAHRTKGVIGNFGAAAAVAKARALEQAGRDGRLEGAGRLLAELSKLAAQLSSELEAELELAASAA